MRKITQDAIRAFRNGTNFKRGNTRLQCHTEMTGPVSKLFLHGNLIAIHAAGDFKIRSAGWETNTTKERLNGFPSVNITQKDFQWYLNGEEWNGEWIRPNSITLGREKAE